MSALPVLRGSLFVLQAKGLSVDEITRRRGMDGGGGPRLTGQLAQVQLEPQLQEPEVEHPQSPMMTVWLSCLVVDGVWEDLRWF